MDSLELRELAIKRLKELEQQLLSSLQGLYSEDEVSGFFLRNQEGLIVSLTSLILAKRQKQAADAPPVVVSSAPVPPPATPDTGTAAPKHFFGPTPWGGYGGRALLPEEVEALKEGSRFVTAEGWHAIVDRPYSVRVGTLTKSSHVHTTTEIHYTLDSNPSRSLKLKSGQVIYIEVEPPTDVPIDPTVTIDGRAIQMPLGQLYRLLYKRLEEQLYIRCYYRQLSFRNAEAKRDKLREGLSTLEERWLPLYSTWERWFIEHPTHKMEDVPEFNPFDWPFISLHFKALTASSTMTSQELSQYKWLLQAPTNSHRLFQVNDSVLILTDSGDSQECVVTQVFDHYIEVQGPQGVPFSISFRQARLRPNREAELPSTLVPNDSRPVFLYDLFLHCIKKNYEHSVNSDFYYDELFQAQIMARALARYFNAMSDVQISVSVVQNPILRHGKKTNTLLTRIKVESPQPATDLQHLINGLTLYRDQSRLIINPTTSSWEQRTESAISFKHPSELRSFLVFFADTFMSAGAELERDALLFSELQYASPKNSLPSPAEVASPSSDVPEQHLILSDEPPSAAQDASPSAVAGEQHLLLPSFGTVRIVLGAQGARDTWHNIFIGKVRYGFNGSRWALNRIPPKQLLDELKAIGITVFLKGSLT